MTRYHAVMLDENYPESQCVQLESPEDTREREQRMYDSVQAEMSGEGYW